MKRAWLAPLVILALVPACKKKERPKPGQLNAPSPAAARKPPNEALAQVPADALAVIVAPTVKTLIAQGRAILGRFQADPNMAAELAKARAKFEADTDIDLSRPESFEAQGISADRPIAMWVALAPNPKDDPYAIALLPLVSQDKLFAAADKRATRDGKQTVGALEWNLFKSKKSDERTAIAIVAGAKWALLTGDLPEDAAARSIHLTRATPTGRMMADGDLWPSAEAAMAPANSASHIVAYLNPARIPMPDSPDAQLLMKWVGDLQGIFMAVGGSQTGATGKLYVSVKPDARPRFAALYQGVGQGVNVMQPIGGTPLFASRMTINLPAMLAMMNTVMGPEWVKVQAEIDQAMLKMAAKTGKLLNFEKDILGRVSGRFGMSMDMPDLAALMQMQQNPLMALAAFSFVLTAQVVDAPALAAALDGATNKLPQAMALMLQRKPVAGGKAWFVPGPGGGSMGGVIIAKDMVTVATGKAFDRAVSLLEGKGGVASVIDAPGLPPTVKAALVQPDANVIYYDFAQLAPLFGLLSASGRGPRGGSEIVLKHLTSMSMVMRAHADGFIGDMEMRLN